MFNNPYMYTRFTPNMPMGMNAARGPVSSIPMGMNAMRGASIRMPNMGMNAARGTGGAGLFSRLGGMFSSLRGFNWGGLINNASKTIGVINQTIPLVKQVGPMVKNMKSVMKIASVFKDETDPVPSNKSKNDDTSSDNSISKNNNTSLNNSTFRDNNHNFKENKKEITVIANNHKDDESRDSNNDFGNSPVFFVS